MHHRLLLSLLCCFLLAATSSTFASTSKLVGSKLTFEQYNITVPFKVNLPVIAVNLVANEQFPGDELVIIGEDGQGKTWLAMYVFQKKSNEFVKDYIKSPELS